MNRKLLTSFALLSLAQPAVAEWGMSIYFGKAFTFPGEVVYKDHVNEKRFKGVKFTDRSFSPPLYYGLRFQQWLNDGQQGIALDFVHAKIYSNRQQRVTVESTQDDTTLRHEESLGETFHNLSLSHGHNFLTLNGLLRSSDGDQAYIYVGGGVGLAMPHMEVKTATEEVNEFQLTGPMIQGFIGANTASNLPVFAEYKLSYGNITGHLPSGATVMLHPLTQHAVVGVTSP